MLFERSNGFFGELLWGQLRTLRELFLVSRTGDDPLPLVCPFKTSPCARSKTSPCIPAPRAHVFQNVLVVPAYTGTF